MRAAWREVRRLAEEFRRRWSHEYLNTLRNRTKWRTTSRSLYNGQLVLLTDELPRDEWKVGRIESCVSEEKTKGRRFNIKMPDGKVFERHIHHVIPLEMEFDEKPEEESDSEIKSH